jgi:hypothetical protein
VLVRRSVPALALIAIAFSPGVAQKVPAISLKPADAKLDEEFTLIRAVRELADGRVLVADARDGRLVVADLRSGAVQQISRTGGGPGEYRTLSALLALGGDSTLVSDAGNRRWLLMDGARIVATLPPETPAIKLAPGIVYGADRMGHVLTSRSAPRPNNSDFTAPPDSMFILLVNRSTGSADTIGRALPQPAVVSVPERNPDGSPKSVNVMMVPLTAGEQVQLFPDGWVAEARMDPYRVDWRAPNGTWRRGAPLPLTIVKVDEKEKRAYLAAAAKASGRPPADPSKMPTWPATVGPFGIGALRAATGGLLLIQRLNNSGMANTHYDLVDRRGALAGTIELPENEKIIGFGAKSVYVAVIDDDGIQRLRRHPWPADRPIAP